MPTDDSKLTPEAEAQTLQLDLDAAGLPWRVYPSGLMGQVSFRAERISTAKHEVFAHSTNTLRRLVEEAEGRITNQPVAVRDGLLGTS